MFRYGYGCGGFGFGGFHMFIPLLILGVIIYAVYKLVNSNHGHYNHTSIMDELNRKFVNGDLTEEEYLQKKNVLRK